MAKRSAYVYAVVAGLLCLLVYLRTLSCGFVNLDDPDYVLNNVAIRQLDRDMIIWAFTNPHAGFWMPLTWISLALDYKFWGVNPLGYHLTNIALHAVNTGLVVLIADRLKLGAAWEIEGEGREGKGRYLYPATLLLAGLIWGLHPLRVESVAWVTERKDVLNGALALASILCYLHYAHGRSLTGKKTVLSAYYLLSLLLFILSLLAKSVSVVLPAMLLVADWYPLNRLRNGDLIPVLAEKLPFLVCSLAMSASTLFLAQQSRILASSETLGLTHRLIVSGNAVFEYCRLIFWPSGILPLHIIDASAFPVYAIRTAVIVAVFLGVAVLSRCRWVVAAMLCFLIPLLPVLALFQNGIQAFASRFTYIPSIVVSLVAAVGIVNAYDKISGSWRGYIRMAVILFTALLISGYACTTWRFIGIWKNTGTVWSRIIAVQPTGRAYKERGLYYLTTGNYWASVDDLTASIDYALSAGVLEIFNLYAFRGLALSHLEQHVEAADDFSSALSMCARPEFYFQRGSAMKALGKHREAAADFLLAGTSTGQIDLEMRNCD